MPNQLKIHPGSICSMPWVWLWTSFPVWVQLRFEDGQLYINNYNVYIYILHIHVGLHKGCAYWWTYFCSYHQPNCLQISWLPQALLTEKKKPQAAFLISDATALAWALKSRQFFTWVGRSCLNQPNLEWNIKSTYQFESIKVVEFWMSHASRKNDYQIYSGSVYIIEPCNFRSASASNLADIITIGKVLQP